MIQPHLYIGAAGTGKTTACLAAIEEVLQTSPTDQVILLVPDPATYMMERKLAEFRSQRGFTTVRVVGMTRLLFQAYQSLGMEKEQGLSKVGKNILLRVLLQEGGSDLEIFKQVARKPHFADVLQGMLTECTAFGVTPEDLRAGADGVDSLVLQRKTRELALLYERYEAALEQLGVREQMEDFLEALPRSPLMEKVHVFVDGFLWFTPVQMQLIQRLFSLSQSCHLTITLPSLEEDVHGRKGAMFYRSWETYQECMKWYPNSHIHRFDTIHRGTPILRELGGRFFSYPSQLNEVEDSISMVKAYHREREADAVARSIASYVEEGHRYKDCMVIVRDMNAYGDLLEKACRRYEIPYFSDQRNPMTSHPLAEFLQGLFHTYQTFFSHDSLFRLLKTDFGPLSREEVDALENYCLEFGIQGAAWFRQGWNYGGDHDLERRKKMEVLRDRLMTLLRPWYDHCKLSHSGTSWSTAIFETMQGWSVPETLHRWSMEAQSEGHMSDSASHVQIYQHTLGLLEECMLVAGEAVLTAEDMGRIVEEGLAEVTYSLVPPSLDHVTITTIDRSYMAEAKEVYVMGLNEGVFPQKMGDEGILKDAEREALAKVGVQLAAGALGQAFNENFLVYLACTRASQRLHLSYATSDEEGAKMEPSLVVQRLQQYDYVKHLKEAPLTMPVGREGDYLWRGPQSFSLLASRLSALMKGEAIPSIWWSLYNWGLTSTYRSDVFFATRGLFDTNTVPRVERSVIQQLLLQGDVLMGSVTRLEMYNRCPYSFYAQYGLQLSPRKVKILGAPEIGTFLHETLRYLGEYLLREGLQWRDMPPDTMEALCEEAANHVMGEEERNAYEEQIYQRLRSTIDATVSRLIDWSQKSEFNTIGVEQSFGLGGARWKPVYVPLGEGYGESIMLRGQIDRIDEYKGPLGTYATIIDYKSGGTTIRADEILYGLKLQLMTYLLALEKNRPDHPWPAAAVYTYVQNPQIKLSQVVNHRQATLEKAESQALKNNGYFLEADVLHSLDTTWSYGNDSPYVPIKLKKDGTPDSRSRAKIKLSEDFDRMKDYTKAMLSYNGTRIMEGHFPISPFYKDKKMPCSYCHFKALCRFEAGRNRYRILESLPEEKALERLTVTEEGGPYYEMD